MEYSMAKKEHPFTPKEEHEIREDAKQREGRGIIAQVADGLFCALPRDVCRGFESDAAKERREELVREGQAEHYREKTKEEKSKK